MLEKKLWSAEKITIPAGSAKLVKVSTEGNWKGAGVEDRVKGRRVLLPKMRMICEEVYKRCMWRTMQRSVRVVCGTEAGHIT